MTEAHALKCTSHQLVSPGVHRVTGVCSQCDWTGTSESRTGHNPATRARKSLNDQFKRAHRKLGYPTA